MNWASKACLSAMPVVSDRHANFFVNAGQASAKDMLTLIADVRERVLKTYGVSLENEVVVWNA